MLNAAHFDTTLFYLTQNQKGVADETGKSVCSDIPFTPDLIMISQ
jgi:hypothetical protein